MAIARMSKEIEVCLALQTQNFSYTDLFLLDRLLEFEEKCTSPHSANIGNM